MIADRPEGTPIAAPNPRAFLIAYLFWETAVIVAGGQPRIAASTGLSG